MSGRRGGVPFGPKGGRFFDLNGTEIRLGDTVYAKMHNGNGCLPKGLVDAVTGFGRTRIKVTSPEAPGRVFTALPGTVTVESSS